MFGELMLSGERRVATVEVTERARLTRVTRVQVERALVSQPDLASHLIQRLIERSRTLTDSSSLIPILDLGTIATVKEGQIRVVPAVQEILVDKVRFAGGAVQPFDAIIFATGYTPG